MRLIDCFDLDFLIMSTCDYYIGRRTANVEYFCQRLTQAWPMLNPGVQQFVRDRVEMAFATDRLGDDCDRRSWEGVRSLWN